MSLQKEFFGVESFNPRPYFDNTILNLSGASKFEADTVFKAGIYSVEIQAGDGYCAYPANEHVIHNPAKITKNIVVERPFIIRAYCGGSASSSGPGINPYSGAFKVNPYMLGTDVPYVSHIFGNSGSTSYSGSNDWPTSGNCLGDGVQMSGGDTGYSSGAGSCLHFIPVGGTFGVNYIGAFHVTAAPVGTSGSGSAYGGAGSGVGSKTRIISDLYVFKHSYNAGSTPHGTGGSGVAAPASVGIVPGNNGTGIGYGAGGTSTGVDGAGAWFDGTTWHDSRTVGAKGSGSRIIVKYLGTVN